jgi:hypothetical protein
VIRAVADFKVIVKGTTLSVNSRLATSSLLVLSILDYTEPPEKTLKRYIIGIVKEI